MHDLGNYCKITREVLGNYIAVVQGEFCIGELQSSSTRRERARERKRKREMRYVCKYRMMMMII